LRAIFLGQSIRRVPAHTYEEGPAMADDDIDLSALSDEELVPQMHDDLYDGLKEEIEEGVNILLERGWTPYKILTEGLVEGMRIVGIDFRDGILFVPEVLLAANAMKAGMAILKPLLAETGAPRVGKMVIGTVKGDIHDIGKNLVASMLEGGGFEVIDLGVDVTPETFVEELQKHEDGAIIALSALLTTTMTMMKTVIEAIDQAGLRQSTKIMIGGAPITEEYAMKIGADGFAADAGGAARAARALIDAG